MRASLFLLLVFVCCGYEGDVFGQVNFYKAKVSVKGETISKVRFFAYDNRNDVNLYSLKNKDEWEIFGNRDGRIIQKERGGESIFTIEFGQEYMEVRPVRGDLSVKYNWSFIQGNDTILMKFPQITRDIVEGKESFHSSAQKKYNIVGGEGSEIKNLFGWEDIVNYSQTKSNALHLNISTVALDCSEIMQLAGAFLSILEMHKRELGDR